MGMKMTKKRIVLVAILAVFAPFGLWFIFVCASVPFLALDGMVIEPKKHKNPPVQTSVPGGSGSSQRP